jgi:hypothetical protein
VPDARTRFFAALDKVLSAQEYVMTGAAGAWTAMAAAARNEGGALSGTASATAQEKGVGLLILSDRIQETSGWAEGAAASAEQIANQLLTVADATKRVLNDALDLDARFHEVDDWEQQRLNTLDGMALAGTDEAAEQQRTALAEQMEGLVQQLGAEYAKVVGAEPPAAPSGGSAAGDGGAESYGGTTASAASVSAAGGAYTPVTAGGGMAQPSYQAPNGSVIGPGEYPGSSILGPEAGEQAGWVRNPATGNWTDPATGVEVDPGRGQWIDPNTGEGFGRVGDSSVGGAGAIGAQGPGAVVGGDWASAAGIGAAGAAIAAGARGLGRFYGGVVPPSVANAGPSRAQMARQAAGNMARRAYVATNLGMREAMQGGRPFVPPPGAAAQRAVAGTRGTTAGRAGAGSVRGGAVARTAALGTGAGAAARGMAPPAAAAAAQGRDGKRRAARGQGAMVRESPRTWRAKAKDAVAGHGLLGRGTAPPAAGAQKAGAGKDDKRRNGKPTDLKEDPSVWTANQSAGPGVLG